MSVEDYLTQNKTTIKNMIRYELGEGIEKVETDFAKEVKAQMKS